MDGEWYSYDDSSVDLIPEEEVCTRGAYILFYERRNAIPPWSASCSVRGKLWSGLYVVKVVKDEFLQVYSLDSPYYKCINQQFSGI